MSLLAGWFKAALGLFGFRKSTGWFVWCGADGLYVKRPWYIIYTHAGNIAPGLYFVGTSVVPRETVLA